MGFVSLLLAVTQDSISKICIPAKIGGIMLPCRKKEATKEKETENVEHFVIVNKIVTNFSAAANGLYDEILRQTVHRRLAEEDDAAASDSCGDVSALTIMELIE